MDRMWRPSRAIAALCLEVRGKPGTGTYGDGTCMPMYVSDVTLFPTPRACVQYVSPWLDTARDATNLSIHFIHQLLHTPGF